MDRRSNRCTDYDKRRTVEVRRSSVVLLGSQNAWELGVKDERVQGRENYTTEIMSNHMVAYVNEPRISPHE